MSDGFVPYVPAPPRPPAKPQEGKTAKEKMAERLLRVRAKEAENLAAAARQNVVKRYRCSSKGPPHLLYRASRAEITG